MSVLCTTTDQGSSHTAPLPGPLGIIILRQPRSFDQFIIYDMQRVVDVPILRVLLKSQKVNLM